MGDHYGSKVFSLTPPQPGQAGTKFEIRSTKFETNSNVQNDKEEWR
jgi:hypothetical protein